ncbi:MAG: helix-turn-helix domain-containing protein [Bdellovibrionaceae bacterium]|nr:helix-turn-helix domain-containing protein [Pseudobdellovibrionaceae bacterium]
MTQDARLTVLGENRLYESHSSTETTTKHEEKKLEYNKQDEFKNNEFKSEKFFENKICKIEDVSKFTGYSIGTLYNLTSKNLIPHRKKRGRLFFVPTEILNWIDEGDI